MEAPRLVWYFHCNVVCYFWKKLDIQAFPENIICWHILNNWKIENLILSSHKFLKSVCSLKGGGGISFIMVVLFYFIDQYNGAASFLSHLPPTPWSQFLVRDGNAMVPVSGSAVANILADPPASSFSLGPCSQMWGGRGDLGEGLLCLLHPLLSHSKLLVTHLLQVSLLQPGQH